MANFSSHKLGGIEGWNTLQTKGVLSDGDTINYAFGIGHGNYRGLRVLQHGGSIGGYRSNLMYFPEVEVGFIILSNFSSANPGEKIIEAADAYLEDQFKLDKPKSREQPSFNREPVEIDRTLIQKYAGMYYLDDFVVEMYVENDEFLAKGPDFPPITLIPTSDSTFFVPPFNIDLVFHENTDGSVTRVTAYNPNPERGRRLDPEILNPKNLLPLVGTYYSPELKTTYQIILENEDLIVQHTRHKDFRLIPIQTDQLVGEAFIFSQVDVVRNGNGSVKGIKVSNGRVRELWFEKLGF